MHEWCDGQRGPITCDQGTTRTLNERLEKERQNLEKLKEKKHDLEDKRYHSSDDTEKSSLQAEIEAVGKREAPLMTSAELLGFHRGRFNDMANLATIALPVLRSLHLDDVNARNIDALADAVWLPQIRSLRIRDTHTIAIGRLLRSRLWHLTELTIETSMPDFTLAWLATSNAASTIERLDLAIGYGDAKTIKAFTTSELPKLETFVVRGKARDEELEPLRKRWGDRLTVQR